MTQQVSAHLRIRTNISPREVHFVQMMFDSFLTAIANELGLTATTLLESTVISQNGHTTISYYLDEDPRKLPKYWIHGANVTQRDMSIPNSPRIVLATSPDIM